MYRCTLKKATVFLIVQLFIIIYWKFSALDAKCACNNSLGEENPKTSDSKYASKSTSKYTEFIRHDSVSNNNPAELKYTLLVVVLTSLDGKERRDTIRQTWYSNDEVKTEVLLKFVLGTMGMGEDDRTRLQKENKEHNDLLLLTELVDSFENLTRKVLSTFVWVSSNVQFSYLLKCDDDTFVVLKVLLDELKRRTSTKSYYWGFFDGRASAKKVGKYQELNWFLCDRYIPYALGGGYVLSGDLVKLIALNSAHLKLYINEDVSVGTWLAPYDIKRSHDVRFDTEYQSRGCNNVYIVTHKQPAHLMFQKHKSLQETGKLCKKEVQYKPSYIYDWSKPPSECCKRQIGVP